MTALGGSAQTTTVAEAQAQAAGRHVDLTALRKIAGERIATITGAEAACVTTGAAAGITLSVAALVTGNNLSKVQELPLTSEAHPILLQAGHAINFGASIEQMITLGGGQPSIIGDVNSVPLKLLQDTLESEISISGFLYVQSHHCVQKNMISLDKCIEHCHAHDVPVIVDAAAEEDLKRYIDAGADLVTYSGGKAFCGPTVGFIAGKEALVDCCELQFRGIARTMKVGKEQIFGLLQALDEYLNLDENVFRDELQRRNLIISEGLRNLSCFDINLKPDEAGRDFSRVAVRIAAGKKGARNDYLNIHDLIRFLENAIPSIRTRNHHADEGLILIDPRELKHSDPEVIIRQFVNFCEQLNQKSKAIRSD
ncbi:MAG: hypothetical protein VB957_16945 [Pseudomonadales bacterium]|jgi:L-seryl-tRNA(Ser) seleniumtransferase/D-glucosaminate-6-phosphate ammonia-lyase